MSQAPATLDPWTLVWGQPYIDSRTLAAAIEQDLAQSDHPDFRTRLLIRDAAVSLRGYWGQRRFAQWLASSPVGSQVREIMGEDLGETGYSTIRRRLVDSIDATQLGQVFELLGRNIQRRVEIHIAGSVPTLIKGLTARPTDDIDLVDEVPDEIRRQRDVLRQIETEFGLKLGHVQSHYLPSHWRDRRHWFGDFGGLRVYALDEYDIFVSKLSSKKKKHQLDLRVLATKLDKDKARQRLLTDGRAFLDDPKLRPQIEENWRFIFQEPLSPEAERAQAAMSEQHDQASDEPAAPPAHKRRATPKKRNPD
jgi:Nucleotidyltransferase of unknown function (DUF6036)